MGELPHLYRQYKHRGSGKLYMPVLVTNYFSTKPSRFRLTVCYTSGDGKVWSRTVEDFNSNFTLQEKPDE